MDLIPIVARLWKPSAGGLGGAVEIGVMRKSLATPSAVTGWAQVCGREASARPGVGRNEAGRRPGWSGGSEKRHGSGPSGPPYRGQDGGESGLGQGAGACHA